MVVGPSHSEEWFSVMVDLASAGAEEVTGLHYLIS